MKKDLAQRWMQALFELPRQTLSEACWQPQVDIYRSAHGWLVKFDLAGVRPGDIELIVHNRRMTVRGVRRDLSILEGQQSYSMEISYNRFERSIELPCDLEAVTIQSDYRDGMYLITILESETGRA